MLTDVAVEDIILSWKTREWDCFLELKIFWNKIRDCFSELKFFRTRLDNFFGTKIGTGTESEQE